MSSRVMSGVADLTGAHINTLTVTDLSSRYPIRWNVVCRLCGTRTTMAHEVLANKTACCRSSGCGRDALRDHLTETPSRARQRELDEAEIQHRQKVQKLQSEAAAYQRRIATLQRERLGARVLDMALIESAGRSVIEMSAPEASRYNRGEIAAFVREHPEVRWTAELSEMVGRYFHANGLTIANREMIARAVDEMREAGMIPEQPRPVVKPVPTPTPAPATVEPAKAKKEPEELTGYDPHTGRQRTYTRLEVDKMSADQYRRTFRVTKADLTLPNHVPW